MESKASWFRLGVCLLALTLAFIGAQILDWAPNVSAQVTGSSVAALVPAPSALSVPLGGPIPIDVCGFVITEPGVYQLATNLSGTSGVAVTVNASNAEILGNGKTIRGDGNFTESTNKETGISIGSHSNVIINGVRFAQLDTAISVANTSPVQDNSVFNVGVDTTAIGINWTNQSSAQNISFRYTTFNYVRNYGIYWTNKDSNARSGGVGVTNSRFTNTGKSGGAYGYAVYFSNTGVAQNTAITSDTLATRRTL